MKKEECDYLYRKYRSNGFTIEQANEKLNGIKEYLKNFRIKLENKKLSPEEIDVRFKLEFEKMVQKAEAERV